MHYHSNLKGITFKLSIEICFYSTALSREINRSLVFEFDKRHPCIKGTLVFEFEKHHPFIKGNYI